MENWHTSRTSTATMAANRNTRRVRSEAQLRKMCLGGTRTCIAVPILVTGRASAMHYVPVPVSSALTLFKKLKASRGEYLEAISEDHYLWLEARSDLAP